MENFNEENLQQSNLPKIKIFQTIQKNLSVAGIDPSSAMHSHPSVLNVRILMNLFALIVTVIFSVIYITIEADTFLGLAQAICVCSVNIFAVLVLVTVFFNMKEFYKSINDCECLVNTSKYKSYINFIGVTIMTSIFLN